VNLRQNKCAALNIFLIYFLSLYDWSLFVIIAVLVGKISIEAASALFKMKVIAILDFTFTTPFT
jgi:hypothetical protein